MLNDEQLRALLEVAEKAQTGSNDPGAAFHVFITEFKDKFDPSTCAELAREVMRLREQIEKAQTCVVCTATLLESETPPHCGDCILTEEHYER